MQGKRPATREFLQQQREQRKKQAELEALELEKAPETPVTPSTPSSTKKYGSAAVRANQTGGLDLTAEFMQKALEKGKKTFVEV
jgi:hypothetical protein